MWKRNGIRTSVGPAEAGKRQVSARATTQRSNARRLRPGASTRARATPPSRRTKTSTRT